MRKTVIFVEGWTEQVWVREYLLKWFEYQDIQLECFTLFNKKIHRADYPFGVETAPNYFQIINAGGDKRVNDLLVEETPRFRNLGFHKIIGLRDMLSQEYREKVTAHIVDAAVIEQIQTKQKHILKMFFGDNMSDIQLCYAIMEIEAWILGLSQFFDQIDARLTPNFIKTHLNLDFDTLDPETNIYNPTTVLSRIFSLVGKDYGKRQGEIDSLISPLTKEDYALFLEKDVCNSFNIFHEAVHND